MKKPINAKDGDILLQGCYPARNSREASFQDRYYIPTRYPNGLPGGVPAQSYQADEAQQALEMAEKTVALVASKFSPATQTEDTQE